MIRREFESHSNQFFFATTRYVFFERLGTLSLLVIEQDLTALRLKPDNKILISEWKGSGYCRLLSHHSLFFVAAENRP